MFYAPVSLPIPFVPLLLDGSAIPVIRLSSTVFFPCFFLMLSSFVRCFCSLLLFTPVYDVGQAILGVDIVCQAKSGMGKTAVFVLATLHQLNPQPGEVRKTLKKAENRKCPRISLFWLGVARRALA